MNDSFFEMVFEVVKLIPKGRVCSYGAIAKYLGSARSSRMVGWAMNQSHSQSEFIPAHRVVNRIGLLTGRANFKPPERMQELLESEGLVIVDHQVSNFSAVFWDPNEELKLP
jgi:methylated-DNA-protein-cysteine methyltransferase related protein